jgi:N-acetylglutamate synthase-like GNAT family acetyltransferase
MIPIKLEEVEIRTELRPGDLGYVTYMHGHLYQKEHQYGVSFEAYVAQGFYEFYQNFDKELDRVWIAEHHGKIVGFLLLMHRAAGEAQLRYFILDPGYRGIGLGKKLSLLYMEHLKKTGYQKSYLWTTDELYTAAHIYRQMGFTLTEEVASEAFGKPLKEQRYDLAVK